MPPAIHLQNTIAMVWDFDKTLTHSYMQGPLFDYYKVDEGDFWEEVNALEKYYFDLREEGGEGLRVGKDTIYLNHILSYVDSGKFKGLTNAKLKELGGKIELAPGLPDFFQRMRSLVSEDKDFSRHQIVLEHYIVSTGLLRMIEGTALAREVAKIWACELLPSGPRPEFRNRLTEAPDPVLAQVGYTIDNTSKTRALFEINKGVNEVDSVDVNTVIPEDQRRVPFQNMIYIADGPSDVPSFSLINSRGGKTLGVYAPGDKNYENAAMLQDQGRVNSIAEADYTEGSAADMWLSRAVRIIASRIVDNRERVLASYGNVPGHVV